MSSYIILHIIDIHTHWLQYPQMPRITITVGERIVAEVEISDKVAREIAVDMIANPLELTSKDKKSSEEKMKLAKALTDASKNHNS
ncbi:MAG: hypothetical protein ACD_19C00182G0027 [uncultured bacterium]|nr:MAG: hypothetical protein ACD_19C00182G0027 [uncultured bacterium]